MKVPQWEEALRLTKELAQMHHGMCYIGWDLCLTEIDWIMIEENYRGTVIGRQVLGKKDLKKRLRDFWTNFRYC